MESDAEDAKAKFTAELLFDTATLRSGFTIQVGDTVSSTKTKGKSVQDQTGFAERIENILKKSIDVAEDATVEVCALGLR